MRIKIKDFMVSSVFVRNTVLFIAFLFSINSNLFSRSNDSNNIQIIQKLDFPYANNYEITLTGKTIEYDDYDFPKKTKETVMKYTFEEGKKGIISNYLVIQDKDTTEESMFLKFTDECLYTWKLNNGKRDGAKHKSIMLPLDLYDSWYFKAHGVNVRRKCVGVDSSITTPYGDLKVFIIYEKYELSFGYTMKQVGSNYYFAVKNEKFVYETWDYYCVGIGYVGLISKSYLIDKNTDVKKRLLDKELFLSDYGVKSEESPE